MSILFICLLVICPSSEDHMVISLAQFNHWVVWFLSLFIDLFLFLVFQDHSCPEFNKVFKVHTQVLSTENLISIISEIMFPPTHQFFPSLHLCLVYAGTPILCGFLFCFVLFCFVLFCFAFADSELSFLVLRF